MNTTIALLSAAVVVGAFLVSDARAGEVSFDGNVSVSTAPSGDAMVARLGTFNLAFDPYSYSLVYGVGDGNMGSTSYSLAVSDGNFRPIGEGTFLDTQFAGTGSASAIQGQQLWLFLFNTSNPDAADKFALFSGTTDAWRAPSDTGTLHISADSADEFVFGTGGHGSPIELQGLPIPEPPSLVLLLSGGVLLSALAGGRLRQWLCTLPNQPAAGNAGGMPLQSQLERP